VSVVSPVIAEERRSKRYMLLSVALNLFFIAVAATMIARSYLAPATAPELTITIDRSAGARIERIAMTLPPADAAIMRAAYRDNAATLDLARAEVDRAVEVMKDSFRAKPYDVDGTRAKTADTRAKYLRFLAMLHDAIATAAGKMSPEGRARLAEYSSARVTVRTDR
jgi:hypothetical protein